MLAKTMTAIARRLSRVPEDMLAEIGRRAQISTRQMRRLRAGKLADMKLSAFLRLAEVLRVSPAELGGSNPQQKRPTPIGRKHGRLRNIRRKGDAGDPPTLYFEDEEAQEG